MLTYIFTVRILIAPEVTPALVLPLALCGVYEFIFDYGQHLHNYVPSRGSCDPAEWTGALRAICIRITLRPLGNT